MNGLILAGGNSSRMGQNKALLSYHGLPQVVYLAQLVAPFCQQVWASCKVGQQSPLQEAGYTGAFVLDQPEWGDIGPMNGILSAFAHENTDWLVVACDYPLLNATDLAYLLAHKNDAAPAVAFRNDAGYTEPLVGLYKSRAYPLLLTAHQAQRYSLKHWLEAQAATLLPPTRPQALAQANTPQEMEALIALIHHERPIH
jgi:molybdenum cofactor guanylyltransferase